MGDSGIATWLKRLTERDAFKYQALYGRAEVPRATEGRGQYGDRKRRVLNFTLAAISLGLFLSLAFAFMLVLKSLLFPFKPSF